VIGDGRNLLRIEYIEIPEITASFSSRSFSEDGQRDYPESLGGVFDV
jgi:hypothetical protein